MPPHQIPITTAWKYQENNFIFSEEMIEQFYKDGFLVVENIFSEQEMNDLNDVLSRQVVKNTLGRGALIGHYIA